MLSENLDALNQVVVPDLWQQQAVSALRDGSDVVVHAPTGAGKTLIFELWSNQGRNHGQAVYTVPTRALANDKLAEWKARGWDVGISTGDLSDNLSAPVVVATLETQKRRLIEGAGPALLVVDEYQMIGDPDRGLNYELALALAPARTQLLLLSGSVANPQDVVKWLQRLGRRATLVRHEQRPVPLDEVQADHLNYHVPSEIRGYWPRFVAKALAEDLGPILIFAPRRQAAEALAAELARNVPTPNPLQLGASQKLLVGDHLARMLKSRIVYHHSGLSYAARAGVIEPLAKTGQLRVVVATMGLAAGINFSLRSVALAGDSYRRDHVEQPIRPDEILQMFGRAGRRGIDDTGYVLVSANEIRIRDGYPGHLSRSRAVDWSALLGVMKAAAERGEDPFTRAVAVQERLFTTRTIHLGVEVAMKQPDVPCGLKTDAERARHVRRLVREMLNSRGEWERYPVPVERPMREIQGIRYPDGSEPPAGAEGTVRTEGDPPPAPRALPELYPVLTNPDGLDKTGMGTLCVVSETDGVKTYGRSIVVAEKLKRDHVLIAKWVRQLTGWNGRHATPQVWKTRLTEVIKDRLRTQRLPVVEIVEQGKRFSAVVSLAEFSQLVPVDRHGIALWRPREREVLAEDCAVCALVPVCRQLPTVTGTALLWRRLGLVDAAGVPTFRGQIVSCFSQGDGLAVAAAIEDDRYPLDELVYDLANLDAGYRFCGEDNRWGGRLADACRERYGSQTVPGYLENGVPPRYGSGAEHVVASVHHNTHTRQAWITDLLGAGDIDRLIIEWRSLMRRIAHSPEMENPRWTALQHLARGILRETESPTLTELPPLEYHQTRRIDHRLILRRH